MQVVNNMERRFPNTGIFTWYPRVLPSRHVRQGIYLDPVRQGVKVPSPDIFDNRQTLSPFFFFYCLPPADSWMTQQFMTVTYTHRRE